jgi:hypothetical protein
MGPTSCTISTNSSPVTPPSRITSNLCKCSTAASYWVLSGPGRMCAFTRDFPPVVRLNCAWTAKLVNGRLAAGKDSPVKASNIDVFPLALSPIITIYRILSTPNHNDSRHDLQSALIHTVGRTGVPLNVNLCNLLKSSRTFHSSRPPPSQANATGVFAPGIIFLIAWEWVTEKEEDGGTETTARLAIYRGSAAAGLPLRAFNWRLGPGMRTVNSGVSTSLGFPSPHRIKH